MQGERRRIRFLRPLPKYGPSSRQRQQLTDSCRIGRTGRPLQPGSRSPILLRQAIPFLQIEPAYALHAIGHPVKSAQQFAILRCLPCHGARTPSAQQFDTTQNSCHRLPRHGPIGQTRICNHKIPESRETLNNSQYCTAYHGTLHLGNTDQQFFTIGRLPCNGSFWQDAPEILYNWPPTMREVESRESRNNSTQLAIAKKSNCKRIVNLIVNAL